MPVSNYSISCEILVHRTGPYIAIRTMTRTNWQTEGKQTVLSKFGKKRRENVSGKNHEKFCQKLSGILLIDFWKIV